MEQEELLTNMTRELVQGGEHVRKLCTELSLAVQEIKRLEKWIDDLQSGMYINCVYCGHQYGPSTEAPMRATLERHIETCPKHPLSVAKAEIATLTAKLVSNRGCIGYTLDLKNQAKTLTEEVARLNHLHKLDHSLADQWQEKNEKIIRIASALVANAVIGPDTAMKGATDCYHVPLDDIDALREAVEP